MIIVTCREGGEFVAVLSLILILVSLCHFAVCVRKQRLPRPGHLQRPGEGAQTKESRTEDLLLSVCCEVDESVDLLVGKKMCE